MSFLFGPKKKAAKCAYQLLSSDDKETVKMILRKFETIFELAIKTKEGMGNWKGIASKVAGNASGLID